MKINLSTQHFSLPLKFPLKTAHKVYSYREGLIVKIEHNKVIGYGEAAPLPGFSPESIKESAYAIEGFNCVLEGENLSPEDLLDEINLHLGDSPAAHFGIETALLDLLSREKNIPLSEYLNPNFQSRIEVNGIAGLHSVDDQFVSIKVKVGFRNLWEEIDNLEKLTIEFGETIKFRLDVNGAFDLPRAIRFCKEVEKFNIDYIEQPLPPDQLEDISELRNHTRIPIAVDESLTNLASAEQLIEAQSADVFIIKPTISGGFSNCKDIIGLARENKIRPVITSALETAVGISACLHMAAANEINDPCGLTTGDLFEADLSTHIGIKGGAIEIGQAPGLGIELL